MGGGKCGDEPAPWVIDLPEERANQLETEMKAGKIVVVKYDCQELKIVRGCDVKNAASYAYSGLSFEPKHKELEDADSAELSLSGGPAIAAKFQADYKNGAVLRIDYAAVGRQVTTTEIVYRDMLEGPKCGEATHFIGAMDVGAYTLSSGAAADIGAAADAFGRGGSVGSTSKVQNRARGGSPKACKQATADDTAPPSECRSPLLVQLFPIERGSAAGAGGSSKKHRPTSGAPFQESCPPGKVMDASGSCRAKSSAASYACSGTDVSECSQQCDKGNPQSCAVLGYMYEKGDGTKEDAAKAAVAYKKACDASNLDGCTGYGYMLSKSDKPADQSQAASVLRTACERGSGRACSGIGQRARIKRDWAAALKEFERGCGLGYTRACYYAGSALLRLDKDEGKALQLMQRACAGGDERGCLAAGSMLIQGSGGKKDPEYGKKLTARGVEALKAECEKKSSESCEVLGDFYSGRYGKAAPQGKEAAEFYSQACNGGQEDACYEAGMLFESGAGGAGKDPSKARSNFDKACNGGHEDACKKVGRKPSPPKK